MATESPDLRFDIDALAAHMAGLGCDLATTEHDWHFTLRSPDLATLERLAGSLEDDFDHIHLEEEVETIENGRRFMGPPLLAAIIRGVLTVDEVKTLADRFTTLARDNEGVTYDGVDAFEPMDDEELLAWLDVEDAVWRLRHFTDAGLEPGDEVPFVFALCAADPAPLEAVAETLEPQGFSVDHLAEDDVEPDTVLLVLRCPGRNDEPLLRQRFTQVESAAKTKTRPDAGEVRVLGIQFFESEMEDEDEAED